MGETPDDHPERYSKVQRSGDKIDAATFFGIIVVSLVGSWIILSTVGA